MPYERITVWEAFDILTAAAQNGEFNNVIDALNELETIITSVIDLTRVVVVKVIADDSNLTTGDGKTSFTVPSAFNGMEMITCNAHVYTVSSSGTPTIQLARDRGGSVVDMLSTRITIDANEKDSSTAATPPVINTSNDDVQTADVIRIDCDVAGTGTKGLEVRMGFRLP